MLVRSTALFPPVGLASLFHWGSVSLLSRRARVLYAPSPGSPERASSFAAAAQAPTTRVLDLLPYVFQPHSRELRPRRAPRDRPMVYKLFLSSASVCLMPHVLGVGSGDFSSFQLSILCLFIFRITN